MSPGLWIRAVSMYKFTATATFWWKTSQNIPLQCSKPQTKTLRRHAADPRTRHNRRDGDASSFDELQSSEAVRIIPCTPATTLKYRARCIKKTLVKSLLLKRVAECQFKEEFSPLWVVLWPRPRPDRRNPVVDWCSGTWFQARRAPLKKVMIPNIFSLLDPRRELIQGMGM